jgi:hypothetical protein
MLSPYKIAIFVVRRCRTHPDLYHSLQQAALHKSLAYPSKDQFPSCSQYKRTGKEEEAASAAKFMSRKETFFANSTHCTQAYMAIRSPNLNLFDITEGVASASPTYEIPCSNYMALGQWIAQYCHVKPL